MSGSGTFRTQHNIERMSDCGVIADIVDRRVLVSTYKDTDSIWAMRLVCYRNELVRERRGALAEDSDSSSENTIEPLTDRQYVKITPLDTGG